MIRRGRVVKGDGLGHKIGYPTANIDIHGQRFPPRGVYAVEVSGGGLHGRLGVANVGTRPTVGGRKKLLEVHLPGFSGSLYGKVLVISFLKKIRSEKKFASLEALKDQIGRDIKTALKLRLGVAAIPRRILSPKKTSRWSGSLRRRPKKG